MPTRARRCIRCFLFVPEPDTFCLCGCITFNIEWLDDPVPLPTPDELKQQQDDDRRWRTKIVRIGEHHLMNLLFFGTSKLPEQLLVVRCPDVPADVRVVSVRHAWDTRMFEILIEHPSFDPVPEGQSPPYVNGIFGMHFEIIPTPGGGEPNPDVIKFD